MKKRDLRRFYTLVAMFFACTLLYYFGELVDWFGWEALRWQFFYGVHDTHRLLFLVPIIYAAYYFEVRASVIVTIIAINTFLPRALFISPYPDPLLRTVLFIVIAGLVGYLVGWETEKRRKLEALVSRQRETVLAVLDGLGADYLIIGSDYVVRQVSPGLRQAWDEGAGQRCYQYLRKSPGPCREGCYLAEVLKGATRNYEGNLPDGRVGEGLVLPYVDTDGKVCQLVVLKNVR